MAHSQPSHIQQALYRFVMQKAPIGHEAKLIPHLFPGAISDQHIVATAKLQGDDNAHLALSLPQLSNKVFIGITDTYPETFAELVASYSAESETNDALAIGHAETLNTPVLSQFGWDAVLMTSPSRLLKGFPDVAKIGDEEYEFILITLITASEYRHWRKEGYASLMQKFGAQKRDLFRFYQKTVGNTRVAIKPKQPLTKTGTPKHQTSNQAANLASKKQPLINPTQRQQSANAGAAPSLPNKKAQALPGMHGQAPIAPTAPAPAPAPAPKRQEQRISANPIQVPHAAAPLQQKSRPVPTMQGNTHTSAQISAQIKAPAQQAQARKTRPLARAPQLSPDAYLAALEPKRIKANIPPVMPAFPDTSILDVYQNDQLDCDPLRVNLGVEPSEAFILGQTEALSVGQIPPDAQYHQPQIHSIPTGYRAAPEQSPIFDQPRPHPASQSAQAQHTIPGVRQAHATPAQHESHAEPLYRPTSQPNQKPRLRASAIAEPPVGSPIKAQHLQLEPIHSDTFAETITDEDYRAPTKKRAVFEPKALSQNSPTRTGVVSKRMGKPGSTKAERKAAANKGSKKNRKNAASQFSKKQMSRRDQQISALDDALTDQWASSIVNMNRETQNAGFGFVIDAPKETSLLELSHTSLPAPRSRWQVLSETALGTLLLVGGLFTTLYFVDTQVPTASVFPGVFAVAGIVTLASAFKDALRLERAESSN